MRSTLLVLLFLVTSCNPAPRTQVMLIVDADATVRAMSPNVSVRIRGGESLDMISAGETREFFGPQFPMEVPIIPRDNEANRVFRVEVRAIPPSGGPSIVVRAASGFVRGQTRSLFVFLSGSCAGDECAGQPEQTCAEGRCQTVTFTRPDTLPIYGTRFDAGVVGDGGCAPFCVEICNNGGDDDDDGFVDCADFDCTARVECGGCNQCTAGNPTTCDISTRCTDFNGDACYECTPRANAGEPCAATFECYEPLVCGAGGTCTTATVGGEGAPCSLDNECSVDGSLFCAPPPASFCVRPCSSDADCSSASLGPYCMNVPITGRKVCGDTLCDPAVPNGCPNGNVCTLVGAGDNGRAATICLTATDTSGVGGSCFAQRDCLPGLFCTAQPGMSGLCVPLCNRTLPCPAPLSCVTLTTLGQIDGLPWRVYDRNLGVCAPSCTDSSQCPPWAQCVGNQCTGAHEGERCFASGGCALTPGECQTAPGAPVGQLRCTSDGLCHCSCDPALGSFCRSEFPNCIDPNGDGVLECY